MRCWCLKDPRGKLVFGTFEEYGLELKLGYGPPNLWYAYCRAYPIGRTPVGYLEFAESRGYSMVRVDVQEVQP